MVLIVNGVSAPTRISWTLLWHQYDDDDDDDGNGDGDGDDNENDDDESELEEEERHIGVVPDVKMLYCLI